MARQCLWHFGATQSQTPYTQNTNKGRVHETPTSAGGPTKTPTADLTRRGLEPLVDALRRWSNCRSMSRRRWSVDIVEHNRQQAPSGRGQTIDRAVNDTACLAYGRDRIVVLSA